MSHVRSTTVPIADSLSHQASLLVSILVRYPEIGSVKFSAADGRISFSVMLARTCTQHELARFRDLALSHLEAYARVTGHTIGYLGVNGITHDRFTQVEVARDVRTVSREELSLLIGLIRLHFGQDLVIENNEPLRDDERAFQEELIDDMLEDLRVGGPERELVGFREAGRVMVFNKSPRGASDQQS